MINITHFGEDLEDPKPHTMKPGKKIGSYEKFPRFFKIYLQEHSSERMKIPRAFISRVGLVFPEMVILRSSNGKFWHVKVIEAANDVFFGKGWKKFVEDNSVEHEEFLVFKYNGGNMFDFKLFRKSECENKERDKVEGMLREEEEEEEYSDDESDHDYEFDEEEEDSAEGETVEVEDEEDEEEEEEAKSSRKRKSKEEIGEFKAHVGLKLGSGFRENMAVETKVIDEPEPEPEPEPVPVLEGYAHLRHPYFFTRVRMWMDHLLLVPIEWMRDHNITLRGKVTYLGSQGRQWPGSVLEWTDGRIWINGWGDFCKANNIRPEACCICELLQDQRGNVLQVHIVRK